MPLELLNINVNECDRHMCMGKILDDLVLREGLGFQKNGCVDWIQVTDFLS